MPPPVCGELLGIPATHPFQTVLALMEARARLIVHVVCASGWSVSVCRGVFLSVCRGVFLLVNTQLTAIS